MRVGYDEQIFLAQRRGGISHYVVRLVDLFRRNRMLGVEPVLGWSRSLNVHAVEAGIAKPPPRLLPATGATIFCFAANASRRRSLHRTPILHHTYYHPAFLAPNYRGVRICTVHDMTPELHPEYFHRRNPHLAKEQFVTRSHLVICVSRTAQRDLVNCLDIDPAKTVVIPLGVDEQFRPGLRPNPSLPQAYVLYVGSRAAYKHFEVLVEAFAGFRRRADLHLVVAGSPLQTAEKTLLRRHGISDKVVCVQPSDIEMPSIYSNAALFVYPSPHEGFGLPTIESMASGTVALLADAPAHREVGSESACYFAPGDPYDLGRQMGRILDDTDLRAQLRQRGIARASTFSWRACAHATRSAYESALGVCD